MTDLKISEREGIVSFDVWVAPRASRSAVLGIYDGRLKVALDAPPVDGKANAALLAYISEVIGVPRRAVSLVRGATGRRKTLAVAGSSAPEIERRVADLLACAQSAVKRG